jgi:hypothetical protein
VESPQVDGQRLFWLWVQFANFADPRVERIFRVLHLCRRVSLHVRCSPELRHIFAKISGTISLFFHVLLPLWAALTRRQRS